MTDVSQSGARQVVVFVRVNNMDTCEVEKQRTFVIDAPDPEMPAHQIITAALEAAATQSEALPDE